MLKEVNDIAGQHEVIAENFSAGLVKQLQTLIQELKTDRKRVGREGIGWVECSQHIVVRLSLLWK